MEGLRKIMLVVLILTVMSNATTMTKEVRTSGLPEKIIGGVIEIVHSHKNKPATQQTYPNQGYQPNQYPQYQQWNSQSTYQGQQGQGFNYPSHYQNQGQYSNYQNQNGYNQGTVYPQNTGNYNPGPVYPSVPVGNFNNGQNQGPGQYPIMYPNPPNQSQYGITGQYQNQQSSQHFTSNQHPVNPQGQIQNTGNYQGPQVPNGNVQGQPGSFHGQGTESGGQNQSFQVSGGHQTSGNGGGPTCVCQAWTKPSETLNDPATEKTEKMNDQPTM